MTGARFPLDRRMLAALRFRDALGLPVTGPVEVRGPGVRVVRKGSGEVVVLSAEGLEDYAASFPDPPGAPAVGSVPVALDLRPAAARLAARRIVIDLPRDPDFGAGAASIASAIEVELPPAASARLSGLAAGLFVTVRRAGDLARVEGALVRVRPAGGRPQARATTNAAGEALVLVPALPLAVPGPGATVTPETAADVDAVVDADAARFHADEDLDDARAAEARRQEGFADPDALAQALADGDAGVSVTPAQPARLRPGETRTLSLEWTP